MMLRRDFMISAGACALSYPSLAQENDWDYGCDILVIGAGAAGLSAAVRASELGARVILIEKREIIGGNTLISGGFLGVIDPVRQIPLGITDSEERHFNDIWINGGRTANPELIRTLVKESQRMLGWLENKGVKFRNEVIEIYGSHHPRCHQPILPNGTSYVRALSSEAMSRKVQILKSTAGQKLLQNDEGRVIGAEARQKNKVVRIRADKAVILTAGGFGANQRMVESFDERLVGLPTNCTTGSTGEMLLSAARIGVSTVDLKAIQCLPGPLPTGRIRVRFHNDVSRFILINSEGKRFVDERSRRDELTDRILSTPQKSCFCIIDNDALAMADLIVQRDAIRAAETGDAIKADSIEDLARKLSIDSAVLQHTIEERNRTIKADNEKNKRFPIAKAPFWAARVGMCVHYTMGGLVIDSSARCLSDGRPVPGLFAAGEITGGIHGRNRIGGNGLADAFTFGMIAAEQAMKNA